MTRFIRLCMIWISLSFGSVASAQDIPKIGAAVYGLNAEFMQIWAQALKAHPAVEAGFVEVTVFDGGYNADIQHAQFQTMIAEGYDAIIFVPIDVDAGVRDVAAAHAAGIPVFGSNTRVNSGLLSAYIGSDDVQAGYMEGLYVLDNIGCKGKVVIIEGPIGQSAQIQRLEGNRQALDECPDVELIAQASANWSRDEAERLMAGWLKRYPGQIKGVIGQNDEMALGAIAAIKAAGYNVEDFTIAGIDGVSDALLSVKSGEMASILQDNVAQAQGALDIAMKAIDPQYEPMSEIWAQYADMPWNGGWDAEYIVPWTPVTLANVDFLLDKRNITSKEAP